MKKLTLALAVAMTAAFAGTAVAEPVVEVVPSELGVTAFDGSYATFDDNGNPTTATQHGYVAVYNDGVEACQGNPAIPGPRGPLVGYIWVGENHAARNQLTPFGNNVGAGNNNTEQGSTTPTGDSPCPAHG